MALPAVLAFGSIPTGATAAYTVPAGDMAMIETIAFTNTTAGSLTVTLNVVRAGQAALTSNQLYSAQPIAANQMSFDAISLPLFPGDQVIWQASGSGLNGLISGQLGQYVADV